MSYNRTIKNRHAAVNKNRYPSVVDYVEAITEWKSWPSTCINGEVFVIFHGHPVPHDEFIFWCKKPKVPNFRTDLTNIDTQNI